MLSNFHSHIYLLNIILILFCVILTTFYSFGPGFVESSIFPIEEDDYDHEYDEVPTDGEPADQNSTPEVRILLLWFYTEIPGNQCSCYFYKLI